MPLNPNTLVARYSRTPINRTQDDSYHSTRKLRLPCSCLLYTSPEDLAGMAVAEGILTARGGMTSHAAVVARGMGKCCAVSYTHLDVYKRQVPN